MPSTKTSQDGVATGARGSAAFRLLKALPVWMLIFLGSCAPQKDDWKQEAVAVPSRWRAAHGQGNLDPAALRKWWKRFKDPVLNALIDEALAGSPDVKTALSRITEARGERSVTLSGLLPSVTGSGSHRIQRHDNQSTGIVTKSEDYNLSLDMSWEIDLFGRQLQNLRAASEDVAESVENYYAAQVTLCGDVATSYVELRGAQVRLEVLRRNVAIRSETTDITRWQAEAGYSDTLELQQAVSTLEQARAAIPAIEETIAQTRNRLAVLCGKTPGALDRLLAGSDSLPTPPTNVAAGIPAEALRNRPDVRAKEDAVRAAYHRKTAAELERFPTIDLGGTLGLEAVKSGTLFSPESAARTLVGSLVGSLAQPVFEGGRITANIHINEARAEQAVFAYESTVLTALSEVENALISIRRTAERLVILDKSNDAATQASNLATQQYEAGEVEILTVLEVQRTQLAVEEERVNTLADRLNAYVQLYKALGGGWIPLVKR